MTFYVYENWRAEDKAVVHRADCKFCNNGEGTGRGTLSEENGKWHGPFDSKEKALLYAESLHREKTSCCGICLNRRNMKKDNDGKIKMDLVDIDLSLADRIRFFCIVNKIEPARKLNATSITISASDIHREMNLINRFPAVCQALSGKKIQNLANIKIVREIGNNPSSEYTVVYEIL